LFFENRVYHLNGFVVLRVVFSFLKEIIIISLIKIIKKAGFVRSKILGRIVKFRNGLKKRELFLQEHEKGQTYLICMKLKVFRSFPLGNPVSY